MRMLRPVHPVLKRLGLLLLCAALQAPAAAADRELSPYAAEYRVRISVLTGTLATELRRTGFDYSAVSTIRPAGITNVFINGRIEESSTFSVAGGGVVPGRYSSLDTITRDQKSMEFRFDWVQGEAAGTIDERDLVIPLHEPVHDRVSIQFELMLKLLHGDPSERYLMLNEDELRPIIVSNIGEKKVKVPFGSFDVVGIQHKTEDASRLTTLWCAEELGYLPVVIEQHRNGKLRVRAVLEQYVPLAETAANVGR